MITQINSRYLIAGIFVAITVYALVLCGVVPTFLTVHDQSPFKFLMNRTPTCSVEVIRKYCLEHDYFPTGGRWVNVSYFPDLCRFRSDNITKERLRECLTRRNVKKIVVLGDSNGMRYFGAANKLLQTFMKCQMVKREDNGKHTPDVKYFTKGTKLNASDIVVHNRDCGGCISTAVKCTDNTNEIDLEYIVMEFYVDTEITTVRNRWQKNCHPSQDASMCRQSNTYQEFIFGEYFEGNYPDVILLFSGNHDKARSGLSKIRGDMEYLKLIIKKYLPKNTKLFWFTKMTENLEQKTEYWKDVTFGENLKTNAFIERINLELFDVLRTEFVETGRIVPFFDMYKMSLDVLHWTVDGVHRRPEWYDAVLSNWIRTFCET